MNWQPNPTDPDIFHITHVSNLSGIIAAGGLYSDAAISAQTGVTTQNIGYTQIKADRMLKPVPSHPGTTVGQFVPFYFCPRSVMLYVVNRGNTGLPPGCQVEIVHLVSRVSVACQSGPWAFTTMNAAAAFTTQFYTALTHLNGVQWWAMNQTDWRQCKDERQAEFLVRHFFPWSAVQEIWVHGQMTAQSVQNLIQTAKHQPPVHVRPDCYYP
ncbi:type II toxin-antitoxin system toxin DNA ADP-ribosyl transferase DarT [Melittangium boletus]|uniref:type II toxin-antitoxin system toxin DNA ADP-ribosyl transferase DarT n=1 Tax=Melittangium boletus TaxID=83453 RepID=UPI003DA572DE